MLDGLAETLRAAPALQARTQAVLQGALPCPDLGDPMAKPVPNLLTSIRLPQDLLKLADALVPRLQGDPTVGRLGIVTRARVLTLALARGLAALDAEYPTQRKPK